jgi:hypothetical protein
MESARRQLNSFKSCATFQLFGCKGPLTEIWQSAERKDPKTLFVKRVALAQGVAGNAFPCFGGAGMLFVAVG